MINVHSITKGIVIDHIAPGLGYKIYQELELDKANYPTALIQNVSSKKMGKKDLIKIDNVLDLNFQMLGLIDPNLTVTLIDQEKITEKIKCPLPEKVDGLLTCHNPRCITQSEKVDKITFYLVNKDKREYRCGYCDSIETL